MSKKCEFCDCCRDNLVRDRLILGLNDTDIASKLLEKRGASFFLIKVGAYRKVCA
jgi:hypothetical protein